MILVALEDVYKDYVMANPGAGAERVNLQLTAGRWPAGGAVGQRENHHPQYYRRDQTPGQKVSVYKQALAGMSDKRLSGFATKPWVLSFNISTDPRPMALKTSVPLVLQGVAMNAGGRWRRCWRQWASPR